MLILEDDWTFAVHFRSSSRVNFVLFSTGPNVNAIKAIPSHPQRQAEKAGYRRYFWLRKAKEWWAGCRSWHSPDNEKTSTERKTSARTTQNRQPEIAIKICALNGLEGLFLLFLFCVDGRTGFVEKKRTTLLDSRKRFENASVRVFVEACSSTSLKQASRDPCRTHSDILKVPFWLKMEAADESCFSSLQTWAAPLRFNFTNHLPIITEIQESTSPNYRTLSHATWHEMRPERKSHNSIHLRDYFYFQH